MESVRSTRSRLEKIALLEAALRATEGETLHCAIHYLCGELPCGKIGVGPSMLQWLARQPLDSIMPSRTWTLLEMLDIFQEVAAQSGPGSLGRKQEILWRTYSDCYPEARKFFLQLLGGELRQGALAGVLEQAVVRAAGVDEQVFRRALTLLGSLAEASLVAFRAGDEGLQAVKMQMFRPLLPMLAASAGTAEEAVSVHSPGFWEWKLDGARIQTHRDGPRVSVYTRSLREVTRSVPEVVEHALSLPCSRFILDGEVLGFEEDGKPWPFQQTMKRFGRKSADPDLRKALPLEPRYFDLLLLGRQEWMDRPFRQRREALLELVGSHAVPGQLVSHLEEGREFYEAAAEAGHEGVMVKSLEGSYEAGKRGSNWLKLKPFHTLDLVVVACEWGSGRRSGWLSNLHLAAPDQNGDFVMLGKTFKGLTDDMLRWQTERFLQLETHREDYVVYLRPQQVVEVAFNDIQESPHYPGGLALRFARVKAYREDKSVEQADSFEAVRELFLESR